MTESDETDKKLFLKINSQVEDQDDLERVLNVNDSPLRMTSGRREDSEKRSEYKMARLPLFILPPLSLIRSSTASRLERLANMM